MNDETKPSNNDDVMIIEEKPENKISVETNSEQLETVKTGTTDIPIKEVKREEKLKLIFTIGTPILILLLIITLFLINKRSSNIKERKNEVKSSKQITAIEEFSYELWPFPNREAKLNPLLPKLKEIEKELINKIKKLPDNKDVVVYGYTSRAKIKQDKKREAGNLVLSTQRARAVVNYLCSRYNIDKEKFKIIGMGSKNLQVTHPTWDIRNRRVIITTEK